MKLKFFILSLILSLGARAEFINIGVYHGKNIKSFEFSIRAGKYSLFSEKGKLLELEGGSKVRVVYATNGIKLTKDGQNIGSYQKLNFVGTGWYNHFLVKPSNGLAPHRYDDNLKVMALQNGLQLINNIDLDNYVAGVVEAEVGRKPPEEYFKLQAIICRTYALSNTHKHLLEGFNLCDQVHCQAYHGKTFHSPIVEAALQTRGAVIVDSEIGLITAAFHSSCGGQTVNSEDVWSKSLYYLRSVEDTFCVDRKNAYWEKRIPIEKWDGFISSNIERAYLDSVSLPFSPLMREKDFLSSKSGVTLEEMRDHFKLRSTYFEVREHGDSVLLCGKGYGHGVGLCQIGAMEMARRGYTYAQILHYYYSGVHIIDLSALDFFKSD